MGAHLNGYTSREQTAYYIKALSKDMPKGGADLGIKQVCVLVSLSHQHPSSQQPGNEVVAEQ